MISLTNGLGGQGAGYMNLILYPFNLSSAWSGFIYTKPVWVGGHSHAYEEASEKVSTKYIKEYFFETIIDGKSIKKKFKVNYPIEQFKVININIRKANEK